MAEARSVDNLSGREMAEFHEAFSLFDKDGTCFRFFFSDFFFLFLFVSVTLSLVLYMEGL